MYPRYNIPQQTYNMQKNNLNGDRFFPGGFIAPFLLGGIAGSLVSRPNYQPYPVYYSTPYPPYYSNNYYYY